MPICASLLKLSISSATTGHFNRLLLNIYNSVKKSPKSLRLRGFFAIIESTLIHMKGFHMNTRKITAVSLAALSLTLCSCSSVSTSRELPPPNTFPPQNTIESEYSTEDTTVPISTETTEAATSDVTKKFSTEAISTTLKADFSPIRVPKTAANESIPQNMPFPLQMS